MVVVRTTGCLDAMERRSLLALCMLPTTTVDLKIKIVVKMLLYLAMKAPISLPCFPMYVTQESLLEMMLLNLVIETASLLKTAMAETHLRMATVPQEYVHHKNIAHQTLKPVALPWIK